MEFDHIRYLHRYHDAARMGAGRQTDDWLTADAERRRRDEMFGSVNVVGKDNGLTPAVGNTVGLALAATFALALCYLTFSA